MVDSMTDISFREMFHPEQLFFKQCNISCCPKKNEIVVCGKNFSVSVLMRGFLRFRLLRAVAGGHVIRLQTRTL